MKLQWHRFTAYGAVRDPGDAVASSSGVGLLRRLSTRARLARVEEKVTRAVQLVFGEHASPFFIQWGGNGGQMQEVHRRATRVAWAFYPQPVRWLLLVASLVFWPFRAMLLALQYTRYYGPAYSSYGHKSSFRQAIDQWGVALRFSIPPYEYYAYELFFPSNRARAGSYFHEYEVKHLLAYLNRYRSTALLSDKRQFADVCSRSDIPAPPILAEAVEGRFLFDEGQTDLPDADLFVKPRYGSKGQDSSRWEYRGEGQFEGNDGIVLSKPELISNLQALSKSGTSYLVQPRLFTHADVADLTGGALPTARIVTGRTVQGEVVLILAVYKIPTGALITDYHDTKVLVSPIEAQTGTLGPAVPLALTWQRFDAHPDTGAPITGRELPDWQQAVTLARRAHAVLDGFVFIGWDVALTAAGPVLLEGNVYWSARLMQRPHTRPLGETAFASISLAHLSQAGTAPVERASDGRSLHFF